MRKTFIIISREYITRVRKKSFILFTLLGPFILVLIGTLPIIFSYANKESQKILVKDDSALINALPDSEGLYFIFKYNDKPLEELKSNFTQMDDGYDAVLYIPAIKPDTPNGIQLYSANQIGITTRSYIENIIADKLEEINLQQRNLNKQDIIRLRPKVNIDDTVLNNKDEKQGDAAASSAIGYGMGFLTYIVLMIYGSLVMRGVMEEKTNRIIEVIISSVKPFQLMMGKIIGIGAVGLTQFIIWGILIFIIQLFIGITFHEQITSFTSQANNPDNMQIANMLNGFQSVNFMYLLGVFILYFLLGYFLYASLFAAIGSLASDDDGDIQMYALPLTFLILISIFIMSTVVQKPDTPLAFWASIIPFSSPVVMPALIPFGIPAWQLILSLGLLTGGFLFTTFIASRIYRTGILMYGKKIKIREVAKWMFYKG